MSLHNIEFNKTYNAYKAQEIIHKMIDEAYKARGLEYGGRMLYDDLSAVTDRKYGWNYSYTKIADVEIHREVLAEVHNKFLEKTNKELLEKFEIASGNNLDIPKIMKACDELINDIKSRKNWLREVEGIIRDSQRKMTKASSLRKTRGRNQNKIENYISIQNLEKIGRAILGRSIEMCPIETGFLRSQARLYVYSDHIRIIYECPYSFYVHENIQAIHPIGQAKFLEDAVQEILGDSFVWVESISDHIVAGEHYEREWQKDSYGRAYGAPEWVLKKAYRAVYVDIYRDLKIKF